ncbi:MAG: UvrD-helicase domain-containing protein [Pseudobdellovibrionaceae bacterium]|nr:MAG: UvrD-helicase domain-containing protein [Pseudobdellovibrionaceae bacterium]
MSSFTLELTDEIVRAGAGAGKTTALTKKVLDTALSFYDQNQRWPQLVVTTFTRKATQELRERLIVRASELKNSKLLDYVASPSQLHISTIHGVLSLFLRQYGHLVDLDCSYTVMGGDEAKRMAKSLVRKIILNSQDGMQMREIYSFEQLTEVARKYYEASLLNQEAKPFDLSCFESAHRSMMLEYAEQLQSWADIIQREALPEGTWFMFSEGLKAIGRELKNNPFVSGVQILEKVKNLGNKPRVSKKDPLEKDTSDAVGEFLKTLKADLERDYLDMELWPGYFRTYEMLKPFLAEFSKLFLAQKRERGQFEMVDLELVSLAALRQAPAIGEAFSEQWDYWLIDEFQDTSPVQLEVLTQLVGQRPTYVVGDPQQSIYLFRGARSELFSQREAKVKEQGGKLGLLQKNYRSDPELLLFFNDFFVSLDPQFQPMIPKSDSDLNSDKVVAYIAKAPKGNDDSMAKDHFERLAILQQIKRLRESGVAYEEICILARTNRSLTDLAHFLNDRNIPTHVHAASGFYERREIMDALALLKFLINPHDNENTVALLRSPWVRVSDQELVDVLSDRPKTLWEQLTKIKTELDAVKMLTSLLASSRESGVGFTFQKALTDLGFFDFSHFHDSSGRREANLWKLVYKLRQAERSAGFNYLDFVNQNVKDISESTGAEENDAVAALEPNRVNLMTIHSSKGLQFPHVILFGMDKRPQTTSSQARKSLFNFDEEAGRWGVLIPADDSGKMTASVSDRELYQKWDQRELKEYQRVLYVALTRAKVSVFLSWVDPPQPGSWASQWKNPLTPGIHKTKSYKYVVEEGPWEDYSMPESGEKAMEVRPLFQSSRQGQLNSAQKFSVSSMLEAVDTQATPPSGVGHQDAGPLLKKVRASADGVMLHRVLEILRYQPEFRFNEVATRWFGERSDEVLRAIEYVQTCSEFPLWKLIQSGHVEWGFQLLSDKGIMEGQIDLWGEVDGEVWVVDYKSGSTKYKERALRQLEIYSEAIKAHLGDKPIRRAIVYPFDEKVVLA